MIYEDGCGICGMMVISTVNDKVSICGWKWYKRMELTMYMLWLSAKIMT